jgi:hypothetical protein
MLVVNALSTVITLFRVCILFLLSCASPLEALRHPHAEIDALAQQQREWRTSAHGHGCPK